MLLALSYQQNSEIKQAETIYRALIADRVQKKRFIYS